MSMPWLKLHADFYYDPKTQSMSESMQRRFVMLLCLRCAGELEKLNEDEVRTALRISLKQWIKTKVLFISKGLIDSDLNLLNWEKRQARYDKPFAGPDDASADGEAKPGAMSSTERSRKCRAKQKACNANATDATKVQRNAVASPVAPSENSLKNQQVIGCNEKSLDIDLDLDSRSLKAKATHARTNNTPDPDSPLPEPAQAKAKATRETTAQAQPSTPGDITDVTKAKATATATATATAEHRLADRSLPDGPAMPETPTSDCSAAPAILTNHPKIDLMPLEVATMHANTLGKGITHADPNPAKIEALAADSKNLAPRGTGKAPPSAKKHPPAPISLKHYLRIRHERRLHQIDDDHPIDQWAKERNFPPEFLAIAWEVFEEKYSKGIAKRYAYDYWPQRFFDSVKNNQYGLWRIDKHTKAYSLSQKGLQAFMDIDIKKYKTQSKEINQEQAPKISTPITDTQPGEYDRGAWFMAELKRRCGDDFADIFSPKKLMANTNAH